MSDAARDDVPGTVRSATGDDYEAVAAFTRDTWPDRETGDYIPRVYHDWIEGEDRETFVIEVDDASEVAGPDGPGPIAGICQGVLLSDHEAWAGGMRVDPTFRDRGVGRRLTEAVFEWARERGATVCRNMVFSWNAAGLGQSRAVGFEPVTEFRWAHPEPDADAEPAAADMEGETGTERDASDSDALAVRDDADAAWSWFARSDAARLLRGLGLDPDESWALAELTRDRLRRVADAERVFAVVGSAGTRAMSYRTRTVERETDGGDGTERWAEYGAAAWADLDAARALFAAIARDAASLDADRSRVLLPESARHVSDIARIRVDVADEPDFVLEADLTAY